MLGRIRTPINRPSGPSLYVCLLSPAGKTLMPFILCVPSTQFVAAYRADIALRGFHNVLSSPPDALLPQCGLYVSLLACALCKSFSPSQGVSIVTILPCVPTYLLEWAAQSVLHVLQVGCEMSLLACRHLTAPLVVSSSSCIISAGLQPSVEDLLTLCICLAMHCSSSGHGHCL